MNIQTAFTRRLLTQIHGDVRKHFPQANLSTAASVTGPSCGQFFVEIVFGDQPELREWFKAADRYEAKFKAWSLYLDRYVPGYSDPNSAQPSDIPALTAEDWVYLKSLLETEVECNENPIAVSILKKAKR